MLTITARLTFWYLAVFGSIIVVIAIVTYTARDSWESDVVDTELQNYATYLVERSKLDSVDGPAGFRKLQQVAADADLRYRSMSFMLVTSDTALFEDTLFTGVDPIFKSPSARFMIGSDYETTSFQGTDYRAYIQPLSGTGGAGSLVLVASLAPLKERLGRLRTLFFIIIPVSLIVASAGGWFMARRALQPVAEITNAAALISSTSLHQRVPVGTMRDELSHLAITFNDMIARLEHNFNSQRRFVADASHDLRTPLTIVQAELELILHRQTIDPETREGVERAASEIDRLNRLANDLLLLAKVDAQQLHTLREPIRLDELIVESVRQLSTLASKKSVGLRVTIDDAVEIIGDPHMLARAFTNVLDNAIKYTPPGGVVHVSLILSNGVASIYVNDTGVGIEAADLAKVFERFYRADRSRTTAGSGLGLAIARAIVDALGGYLTITSRVGVGTSVQIAFPH